MAGIGNQLVSYSYKMEATSKLFNSLNHGVLDKGVYSGAEFLKAVSATTTEFRITPGTFIFITENEGVAAKITTQEVITIDKATYGFDDLHNTVVARFKWLNAEGTYMEIRCVDPLINEGSLSNRHAEDIILGTLSTSLGLLNSTLSINSLFNTENRDIPSIRKDFIEPNFRVYATVPYTNSVNISSGHIQAKSQEIIYGGVTAFPNNDKIVTSHQGLTELTSVSQVGFTLPSASLKRKDLIYLVVENDDLRVEVLQGTAVTLASTAIAPEYLGRNVIAEVTVRGDRSYIAPEDIKTVSTITKDLSKALFIDLKSRSLDTCSSNGDYIFTSVLNNPVGTPASYGLPSDLTLVDSQNIAGVLTTKGNSSQDIYQTLILQENDQILRPRIYNRQSDGGVFTSWVESNVKKNIVGLTDSDSPIFAGLTLTGIATFSGSSIDFTKPLGITDNSISVYRNTASGTYGLNFIRSSITRGYVSFDFSSSQLKFQADGSYSFRNAADTANLVTLTDTAYNSYVPNVITVSSGTPLAIKATVPTSSSYISFINNLSNKDVFFGLGNSENSGVSVRDRSYWYANTSLGLSLIANNNDIRFYFNIGTESARMFSSGRWGFGAIVDDGTHAVQIAGRVRYGIGDSYISSQHISDYNMITFSSSGVASSNQYLIAYSDLHNVTPLALALKNLVGDIGFYTGASVTERLKITKNGEVLIGTISSNTAGSKLQVVGETELRDDGAFPLTLYRSSKVANAGVVLNFGLNNSNDIRVIYSRLVGSLVTNTAGSEKGELKVGVTFNGSNIYTTQFLGDSTVSSVPLSINVSTAAAEPLKIKSTVSVSSSYLLFENDLGDRKPTFGVGNSAHPYASILGRGFWSSNSALGLSLLGNNTDIRFYKDLSTESARMFSSGRWGFGTTVDDGANTIQIVGGLSIKKSVSGTFSALTLANLSGATNDEVVLDFSIASAGLVTSRIISKKIGGAGASNLIFQNYSGTEMVTSLTVGYQTIITNKQVIYRIDDVENARIFSSGRWGFGTTTDNGYTVQVAGTLSVNNKLTIGDSLITASKPVLINSGVSSVESMIIDGIGTLTGLTIKVATSTKGRVWANSTSGFFAVGAGNETDSILFKNGNALFGSNVDTGEKWQVTGTGKISHSLRIDNQKPLVKLGTIADLKAYVPVDNEVLVKVSGYYTANSCPDIPIYSYDPSSTETPNNYSIIQPTAVTGAGRFKYNVEVLDASWSPAIGDGVTDDSTIINELITKTKGYLIIDKDYYVPNLVNLNGIKFKGSGRLLKDAKGSGKDRANSESDNYQYVFGREYLSHFHQKYIDGWTAKPKVIFSGDSTTWGVPSSLYNVNELFENVANAKGMQTVYGIDSINAGHSGESTATWLSTHLDVDMAQNPNLYVLRWGINDGALNPATFLSNLRAGLYKIRVTLGKQIDSLSIILMAPNSTNDTPNGRDATWYESQLQGLKEIAREFSCVFIDTYSYFRNVASASNIYMDDPYGNGIAIHPYPVMYQWITSIISDVVFPDVVCSKASLTNFTSTSGGEATTPIATVPSSFGYGLTARRTAPGDGYQYDGNIFTLRTGDETLFQINFPYGTNSRDFSFRVGSSATDQWSTFSRVGGAFFTLTSPYTIPARPSAGLIIKVEGSLACLSGYITIPATTIPVGGIIATIPAGVRITTTDSILILGTTNASGIAHVRIEINPDGTITCPDGVSNPGSPYRLYINAIYDIG